MMVNEMDNINTLRATETWQRAGVCISNNKKTQEEL